MISSILLLFKPRETLRHTFFFSFKAGLLHGSYNLEKVLNFTSRLEKSLKFTTLSMPDNFFSVKLDYFAEENLAHPWYKKLQNSQIK